MKRIRYGLIVLSMLLCAVTSATAEVSISIGLPRASLEINLPMFPNLVQVPGFPVYYAPRVSGNYFFYDGMYWVYQGDTWYTSSWYNGPWGFVEPEEVPLFILRIPLRYYRQHPAYFRGWLPNEPPHWGEHWGREWENSREGWDRWERRTAPAPAPLPVYQRQYSGNLYPRAEEQQTLHREKYSYEPRDTVVRQHALKQSEQKAPAPVQREMQKEPAQKNPKQQDSRRSSHPQDAPATPSAQATQRSGENVQKPAPTKTTQQQRSPSRDQQQPVAEPRERQAPTAQGQGQRSQTKAESQKQKRTKEQDQNTDEEKDRGRERNR